MIRIKITKLGENLLKLCLEYSTHSVVGRPKAVFPLPLRLRVAWHGRHATQHTE